VEFAHYLAKEGRIQMGVDLDRLSAGKAQKFLQHP
jgi:hypothetical protein